MPLSTKFLAEFVRYRTALLAYWLNIVVLGLMLYISWAYATRANLIKDDLPPATTSAICNRILIAQSLYAFGAILCIFSTYWSIAAIVLLQLNYVIAPGFKDPG
jgi:uncharacterized membrane protein